MTCLAILNTAWFTCLCLQVLLYDLRSSRPLLVKDHYYNLPIKSINFHDGLDLVLSADSKIVKMWNKNTVRLSVYNCYSDLEPWSS